MRVFSLGVVMLALLGAFFGAAHAESVQITGIRTGHVTVEEFSHSDADKATRLVIETSTHVDLSMLLLSEPYRLVLDLPTSNWNVPRRKSTGGLNVSPLKSYRLGTPKPGITRLVFDLDGPAAPIRAFRLPPNESGHRFVVDVMDRGATAFKLASSALLKNRGKPLNLGVATAKSNQEVMLLPHPRPAQHLSAQHWPARDANGMLLPHPRPARYAPARDANGTLLPHTRPAQYSQAQHSPARDANGMLLPQSRPGATAPAHVIDDVIADLTTKTPAAISATSYAEQRTKWVVFIDAGHGGKDPGAIGTSGQHEKEVTLRAALELARQLNATGRVQAVLSRDRDVYHKLRKRINLARAQKADVFISLHADAAHSSKAHGVSVFTLSDKASDKEAAHLASRENKADLIGGPDLDTTDTQVATALLGMFQRESMNQSAILAKEITKDFEGLPTAKRGHRFAGFAVLKSPDIPSVLIEMGFLTNRRDEARLKSKAYIRDLMARITHSVIRYLEYNT